MFGMFGGFGMMMCPGKGKLIESIITPEVNDILTRNKIDTEKYIVFSGLLQITEIIKENKMSKKDKIDLLTWSLDVEKKLGEAEQVMIKTIEDLFKDYPVLEAHRSNFPVLMPFAVNMMNENRKDAISLIEKDLEKVKKVRKRPVHSDSTESSKISRKKTNDPIRRPKNSSMSGVKGGWQYPESPDAVRRNK